MAEQQLRVSHLPSQDCAGLSWGRLPTFTHDGQAVGSGQDTAAAPTELLLTFLLLLLLLLMRPFSSALHTCLLLLQASLKENLLLVQLVLAAGTSGTCFASTTALSILVVSD